MIAISGWRCAGATAPRSASWWRAAPHRGRAGASAAFGATLMTATFTLFPLLGYTPAPWRWPADVMATSLGTHVAYVAVVAAVDDGIRRRTR